ncbi:DUF4340 domain-containing protein [Limnoglobus roseus]|uniref:DUF4340 domain-containing protein n=1 Tax=Limnoglobus roseus TaxID=2598579 RepID=A0A5C1A3D7_9BACT|nr:DUF4340 domain-containing protein [Limnoglobus roseus]QEL13579.1 DUF4340 domain-containing protein [Limnoglobus roseus]
MRWFTTILLLVLVAGAAVWLWKGDSLAPSLGFGPPAAVVDSPVEESLGYLKADEVTAVTLTNGGDTLSLVRGANGTWTQPGNWPVRQDEAKALVAALTTLKSRFQPITTDGDYKPLGLDASQKPITVKLDRGDRTTTLVLGRPTAKADEPEYARPTYIKVNGHPDVLRFDSDLMQVVARKPEEYRRKQLFPEFERVKLNGGEPANPGQPLSGGRVAVVNNDITAIKLESGPDGVALKRVAPNPVPKADRDATGEPSLQANKLALAWELDAIGAGKAYTSLRDRLDPAKLRGVVTAIPELWVEQFLPAKPATETGLDKPLHVLTVTRATGPTTLKVGKQSRKIEKDGPPPPPAQPFAPPPPPSPKIIEAYHYASIDGLDLLFEVKADKFPDLFPKLEDLRDANLARFEADEVTKVEVALKGQPPITLTKKKGNKAADKDDEKQDRWYVGDVLAEAGKVTELLDSLGKLEAKNPPGPMDPLIVAEKPTGDRPVIDNPTPKMIADLGLDGSSSLTLTVQEKSPEGQTPPAPRTIKYLIGKDDVEKKKLNVQVAGWNRVNVVADDVKKLIDRPTLAYRGRRLFDTVEAKLTGVTVTKPGGDFALQQTDAKWKLTKPLAIDADAAKASQLTGDLSRLEVTEYVDDAPKLEDLDKKYGLKTPALTVQLAFAGGKDEKLEIGSSPEFKPEYYARRNGTGSVFTVPKATIDTLKDGALAFLPLQLWSVPPDKVASVEVQRDEGKETYKLTQDAGSWKITGPFDAPAAFLATQPLAAAVANVRAEKYDAATADPAKHGLDKPAMKLVVSYKEAKADDPKVEQAVTRTLLIGKPADVPNTRYAKLADGPNTAVFVMTDALVKDVDKSALELLDKSILVQDPAKLTKVQIVGPKAEENVTLVKDDKGAWKADGANFTPDAPTVQMLAAFAARPSVQKIAAYGPAAKWADYGLDKPEYTITATFTDMGKPTVHTIKLGKPDGKARFVRVDDGPAVGVLAPIAAEALARGKLDFADRSLLTFDPPALMAFTRKKGADELEIVQGATVGWDIVKPAKLKADQAILDDLSEQLSRLRATKVAAYGTKDLKPFGLDEPTATITLKVLKADKPEDKVLKVGKPVDEKQPTGDRYAMVDGKADVTVGVLPAALANRLLGDPLKFRDRALARFQKVDRIEMTRGDRTVTFADVNGTWKVVKPVEAEAEQADIDELINALAKLQADELEADKPKDLKPYGLDKPTVKWVLKNGDTEAMSLLVGSKKDGRAFVKLEKGDLVGLLDPSLTAKVTGEYRKRAVWTGIDASQVENVEIKAGDSTVQLTKVGMAWADTAKPTDIIDAGKVSELLDALAGLKALRYASDKDADLKLYGLQPPQRTITISQRGGVTKTLQIGREEGGSNGSRLYARVDEKGRTDVFVLSEADTQKLTRDRAAFAGKK